MTYMDPSNIELIVEKNGIKVFDKLMEKEIEGVNIKASKQLIAFIRNDIINKQQQQIQTLQEQLKQKEELLDEMNKFIDEFRTHLITIHLSGREELLERPLDFLIALYQETEGIKQKTKKTEETKELKKEIKEPIKNF